MSALQVLWIIWVIEVSAILSYVSYIRARNFSAALFSFIGPGLGLGVITYLLFSLPKQFPAYFKREYFTLQFSPWWSAFLKKAVWVTPLAGVGIVLIIILFRWASQKFAENLSGRKKRIFEREREEKIPKYDYSPQKYFVNDDKYFIGLETDKDPVYITENELTRHIQVVGPSGTGKTVSALLPLAVQAIRKQYPVIFIDGKGDAGLTEQFKAIYHDLKLFCPILPEHSNTYNPLLSSQDANELTNLLSVGMNIKQEGDAKVYTDIQKKFLGTLLHLFVATGKNFCFTDIVEFMNYKQTRNKIVYPLARESLYKTEMDTFFEKLSQNEKELIGLSTDLDRLFVMDNKISSLINTYNSEIKIKSILKDGGVVLFSFSAGTKAETNEALAKMVLADLANAVGERHATLGGKHKFVLVILDEFGQYATDDFDKFISTARSANVGCVLSHQTNAQLETYRGGDKLARIVRENTSSKIIFRQMEEAGFWAECFGTKGSIKRTEQTEMGELLTEQVSDMSTLREVDEFMIHPNTFKNLQTGQAIWKSGHTAPVALNLGMLNIENKACEKKKHAGQGEGLRLREQRLNTKTEKEALVME